MAHLVRLQGRALTGKAAQHLSLWCGSQCQEGKGTRESTPLKGSWSPADLESEQFREWLPEFMERIKLIPTNDAVVDSSEN